MFDHLLLRCQNFICALLNGSGLPFQQLFLLLRHHADVHLVLRHDVELTVAVVLVLREGYHQVSNVHTCSPGACISF